MRIALAIFVVCTAAARADDLFPLDPSKSTKSLPDLIAQLQGFKLSEAQRQKFLEEFQKKSPEEQLKLMQQLAGMVPPQPSAPPPGVPQPPTKPNPDPGLKPPEPQDAGNPPVQPPPNPPAMTPTANLPKTPPGDIKAQLKDNPGLGKFADLWEKNVGPLDKTPELQKALLDMAKSADFSAAGGGDSKDGEDLLKLLENSGIESSDLKNWIDNLTPDGGWKLPETGLTAPSAPSAPTVDLGGLGSFTLPDIDAMLVVVLVAVAVAVFLVLRFLLPKLKSSDAVDLSRAAWPVAPGAVVDRPTLVKAFEFISLQLCGDAARVWHHRTIAGALRTGVVGAAPVADRLADLYELARYAPPNEPLPAAALADARRCFGVLAGAGA